MTGLQRLPASVLTALGQLTQTREQTDNLWLRLSPEAHAEGVAMLVDGIAPGFGWWKQHLPPKETTTDLVPPAPPMPPRVVRTVWEPWELIVAGIGMAEDGVEESLAAWTLAQLAADHGLSDQDIEDATLAHHDHKC